MKYKGIDVDVGVTRIDVRTRDQHLATATDFDGRYGRRKCAGGQRRELGDRVQPDANARGAGDRIRTRWDSGRRVVQVAGDHQKVTASGIDRGKADLDAFEGVGHDIRTSAAHRNASSCGRHVRPRIVIRALHRVRLGTDDQATASVERDGSSGAPRRGHVAHDFNVSAGR